METANQKKKKPEEGTDAAIVAMLPDDIVALIIAVGSDPSLSTESPEVQSLLPSSQVMNAVLANAGLRQPSPASEVALAQEWVEDQVEWQNRAMSAEKQLQSKFPFTREEAKQGNIPGWMAYPWSAGLLYKWSKGLQSAVLDAESYILQNS
jgi:hypothetical protein